MSKEIKVGLAVIAVLLCVFGGALAWRLRTDKPAVAAKSAEDKSAAKKPRNQGRAKITAGNHSPAFKTTAPAATEDAFAARDRYAERYAATDDRSDDASDVRQNAWSNDAYSNPVETEITSDEAPDVADSPYGRNRFHQDVAEMANDVAMPEDRFAGNAATEPSWARHEEAVDDTEGPNQPQLSVDPYADRVADHTETADDVAEDSADETDRGPTWDDGLRLAPLATSDRAVRSAEIGYGDEDGPDRELSDTEFTDPADHMAADAAPPRRLANTDGDEVYRVEANDNFWLISQKVYGTGAYFKALQEHNRGRTRETAPLRAGDEISTPPLAVLRESYPDLCPKPRSTAAAGRAAARGRSGDLYTVAEGDTLFDIARHELGKASRWLEIYELNRDQLGDDFTRLPPGTQLALPDESPEPIASRPRRDTIQR